MTINKSDMAGAAEATASDISIREQKRRALGYILDAWEEAVYDGVEPDMLATAAMFASLSDMVTAYGEEPVAKMADRLSERIRLGEFTLNKITQ